MAAVGLSVLHPVSTQQALQMMQDRDNARFVAGGTALQLEWARGLPRPRTMINLGHLPDITGISAAGDVIRVGAATPVAILCTDAIVAERIPMLAAAAGTVAAPGIRNLGTIGGNVAGRTGCLLPTLLVLDAFLEVSRPDGRVHESLLHWLSKPARQDEIIEAIYVSCMKKTCRWTQRKVGLRAAFTPSVIGVAGCVSLDGDRVISARLAVGGGIVAPARLSEAEADLVGASFSAVDWERFRARLADGIVAPDDAFRSGRYRRMVAANALAWGLAPAAEPRGQRVRPTGRSVGVSGEIRVSHADQPERWHIRPDVEPKISGTLAYLTDRREPDMLVGRILRAGMPHARIVSIDTSAAEAMPGVVAVVTHRDVAGDNAFGIVIQDQPAFCFDKVRYVGDPVAAVAAIDAETAAAALDMIKVEYEPLPVVDNPLQALEQGASAVHAGGNLQCIIQFARGDIDAGFASAAHIVERTYTTSRQMHGFMETEGGYAKVEEDGMLAVHVGGQHGGRDRLQLSRILGIPEERIRVVTSPTGGAFGGKDELTVQPALALLALKSCRPVRIHLSRAESVVAGIKRHPMTIRMRTACDAEGRLMAQEVDVLADAGAYASLGPGVLETAMEHVAGPYVVENVKTCGRLAYTNNGVCGAFRGFGANQMTYAIECQMDELGALCGLTPFEIRRRNLRIPGTPGYLGQAVAPSERLAEMLDAAGASDLWNGEVGAIDPDDVVGVGMALNYQGNGLGSVVPDPAGGRLRLTEDGLIEAAYGLDEMGQGLLTSIRAAVSAEMGCSRDDVLPVIGDTKLAPDSGSTTASRGGYVVWHVAKVCGWQLSSDLLTAAGVLLKRPAQSLQLAPHGFVDSGSNSGEILLTYRSLAQALDPTDLPSATITFDFPATDYPASNARYIFAFGACLARVAVNRVTGAIRVLDIHQHTAAGPMIDVAAYLGQMEGGAIQGLGFTLTENAIMADAGYITANLDTYMLPGIRDTAERISVFALEDLDAGDELGPRGAGELGIGAITPAIANAVADAIGYRPQTVPFSQEDILDATDAAP
jgi:xanthine dehydrogenase D subunit/xanthine dehydrogenase C subunit